VARHSPGLPRFLRGDASGDGRDDLSDVIRLLGILFLGEDAGPCPLAADVDGDGSLLVNDAAALAGYLFLRGLAPAPPFPQCGRYGGVEAPGFSCAGSACAE